MSYIDTMYGRFYANVETGQNAEEVYDDWLANKDAPPPLSETEKLRLEMARSNAEMFEMMVAIMGGGM